MIILCHVCFLEKQSNCFHGDSSGRLLLVFFSVDHSQCNCGQTECNSYFFYAQYSGSFFQEIFLYAPQAVRKQMTKRPFHPPTISQHEEHWEQRYCLHFCVQVHQIKSPLAKPSVILLHSSAESHFLRDFSLIQLQLTWGRIAGKVKET